MTKETAFQKVFTGPGAFEAYYDAQDWLKARGFSCGSGQRGAPSGLLFGDFTIAKWKNLTLAQRLGCHGELTGDHRHGPVTVTLFRHAPQDAIAAARTTSGTGGGE
jgi:hypothetical protein